jgi:hypothetical protein
MLEKRIFAIIDEVVFCMTHGSFVMVSITSPNSSSSMNLSHAVVNTTIALGDLLCPCLNKPIKQRKSTPPSCSNPYRVVKHVPCTPLTGCPTDMYHGLELTRSCKKLPSK